MNKDTKKVILILVILVLILAIVWVIYESLKPEPVSIDVANTLPNENLGIDNITNVYSQENVNEINSNNIANSVDTNQIANEINDENSNNEETTGNEDKDLGQSSSNSGKSEIVEGTNLSREERAVEIAKKYYKEEYGSTDGIYFDCEEINSDGRYIVRAGSAGKVNNKFLIVDLDTELVEEK